MAFAVRIRKGVLVSTTEGFFYGLYMDPDLLRSLGFNPSTPRIASIDSYELDLRGAAKILPVEGSTVWGALIELPENDLDAMYSFDSTIHYKPEIVYPKTMDGKVVRSICYNLPKNENDTLNIEYLKKLIAVAKKLTLPGDYIRKLETMYDNR